MYYCNLYVCSITVVSRHSNASVISRQLHQRDKDSKCICLCFLFRSPPQPKTSPISVSIDGIEPVSPAGANSEPEVQAGASYPDQGEQG